jgi:hypothetical protein
LEVSKSGYVPFVAEITLDAGSLAAAHVEMAPISRPLARTGSDGWAWASVSVSAALLIGSGVFGLVALSDRDRGDFSAARRWAVASDLSLGGALCSALGATLLFLSSDHRSVASQEHRARSGGASGP